MRHAFWDPSKGLHGLYDIWTFKGIEALVSSGLGGGSLIYANVLIRKDGHWFVEQDPRTGEARPWPITRAELEPHYDRVERTLGATPYPFDQHPYEATAKTAAMKQAAEPLEDGHWSLPNLAITFSDSGRALGEPIPEEHDVPNIHKQPRYTCRLVGECDIGCNFGSKNSLDHTYLSRAAVQPRASIRTRAEVRMIRAIRDGSYEVGYVDHSQAEEGAETDTSRLPVTTLVTKVVVVAAGALGSTYLLLKNQDDLGGLPRALGTRFCGNGDLLGFIRNARRDDGGVRLLEPSFGPVITSSYRREPQGRKGFYIQDGGYPNIAGWMRAMTQAPNTLVRAARFLLWWMRNRFSADPHSNIGQQVATLLEPGGAAAASYLPVLGMGRDTPDGRMFLNRKGFLENDWTIRTSRAYFDDVRSAMGQLAQQLSADFSPNPTWYFRRVVTVHPLGGCPMGRNEVEGVVDSYGRVFGHPGLYVVDGSTMPGPVGPNPSLTIAAFADRCADAIIDDRASA